MERLEHKKINGIIYYYYSGWGWKNGKCRRLWQKYLGRIEDIVKAVEGGGPAPKYAEIFQWGLPSALWNECRLAKVIEEVNGLCPKRSQKLSTGEYIAIAAINRAIFPSSKKSMWEWFSQTVLLRHLHNASQAALTSQRFWYHMDKIGAKPAQIIWENIMKGVVKRENIDLSSISYDGTNFYTFIDTFNMKCKIAKRGKNKQGRNNLRQVSYALFCCADGHMPLFYDIYEGNRNDSKQFPIMLGKFHLFLKRLFGENTPIPDITLVFDKGNNSSDNFALIDSMPLNFVGSVKLDGHKELAEISNNDPIFRSCQAPGLEETKAFRVKKKAYGKERIFVVSYNKNLFNSQWLTIQNDIANALKKLALLQQRLEDRSNGIIKGGKAPTLESVRKQCDEILSRQHLKNIINKTVRQKSEKVPTLEYELDTDKLQNLSDTYLGKNIIITNREDWDDDKIIKAYRSQFIIENVFKEMKDRTIGNWWPQLHWTDSKITVHALYCTIALLLRAVVFRRVKHAGVRISMKRLLTELHGIREVINVFPLKRRQKFQRQQTVYTKTSEVQQKLMSILGLKNGKMTVLGHRGGGS